MITGKDIYNVLAAIVPLYVAMVLAYGSVRWWKIFTPDQCSGINRFVAVFAVPLLSFHFISSNDPYSMNYRFIAADSLQKVVILVALFLWQAFSKNGSLEWMITLFSLSTLPNTLVMGIPLLKAMYGDYSANLMVQIVVLQSVIWYTLMLFMFEYRGAKLLITEQFPETAGSITSFRVESDVISLNGHEPLQADAEIGDDGKLHVVVRRSNVSSTVISSSTYNKSRAFNSITSNSMLTPKAPNLTGVEIYSLPSSVAGRRSNTSSEISSSSCNKSGAFNSVTSVMTPKASNLTNVEIYSVPSSQEPNQTASSFNQNDLYTMVSSNTSTEQQLGAAGRFLGSGDVIYSLQSSKGPTPRTSNVEEAEMLRIGKNKRPGGTNMSGELLNGGGGSGGSLVPSYPRPLYPHPLNPMFTGGSASRKKGGSGGVLMQPINKERRMFVWSSSASPVSDQVNLRHAVSGVASSTDFHPEITTASSRDISHDLVDVSPAREMSGDKDKVHGDVEEGWKKFPPVPPQPDAGSPFSSCQKMVQLEDIDDELSGEKKHQMPPAGVMTRLILIMVWRKLIRNPNTYSSLLGVAWSLVSYRWHIEMPSIVRGSISILSDAGLGMAMFSLGLFMALQPKIIACGKSVATFSMAVRFLTGPAVIAATSIAVGIRGVLLHVAIVQAALPQGIVPFVFAKEYNVHADILSTAVIFGMLVAMPITILYYILLGL